MLVVVLDAAVLIVLLKTILDEEVDWAPAWGLAIGTSITAFFLALGLTSSIGRIPGLIAAA